MIEILRRSIPDREIWAFGSRALGGARRFSDLDLAILGDTPVPLDTLAALHREFDDSALTIKVDVIDWATTGASFREVIRRDHVVLQTPEPREQV